LVTLNNKNIYIVFYIYIYNFYIYCYYYYYYYYISYILNFVSENYKCYSSICYSFAKSNNWDVYSGRGNVKYTSATWDIAIFDNNV